MAEQVEERQVITIDTDDSSLQSVDTGYDRIELLKVYPDERDSLEVELLPSGQVVFRLINRVENEVENELDGTTYKKFQVAAKMTLEFNPRAADILREWLEINL